MKKIIWLAAGAVILAGVLYLLLNRTYVPSNNKNIVVATIQPVADMTRIIADGHIDVVEILPPGASPHTYELTPDKIKAMTGAKSVFAIGVLDNWIDDASRSLNIQKFLVNEGIALRESEPSPDEPPEEFDPHYWLTVPNAKIMAQNIANELARLDPAHASDYSAKVKEYLTELNQLDQEMHAKFSSLTQKNLITFHDSWNYFAAEYGFTIAAVFEPSPGKEPTPQYARRIYETAKTENIPAIFSEPTLPTSTLEPFVKDLGIKMYVLDPEGGVPGVDGYIAMMRYNTDTIVQALR